MPNQPTHLGIVVGVDSSSTSRNAARWAAREAIMRNVPLTIVHVIFAQPWGPALFGQRAAPVAAEPNRACWIGSYSARSAPG